MLFRIEGQEEKPSTQRVTNPLRVMRQVFNRRSATTTTFISPRDNK